METVFGRHIATGRLVSGAYKTEFSDTEELLNVSKRVEVCILAYLTISSHGSQATQHWGLHQFGP